MQSVFFSWGVNCGEGWQIKVGEVFLKVLSVVDILWKLKDDVFMCLECGIGGFCWYIWIRVIQRE